MKQGDIVRQPGDSILMTVFVVDEDWVDCRWFDEDGVLQRAWFPRLCLVEHEQEEGVDDEGTV